MKDRETFKFMVFTPRWRSKPLSGSSSGREVYESDLEYVAGILGCVETRWKEIG
jgi:hypothetical protein